MFKSNFKKRKFREVSYFFWLLLLIVIIVFSSNLYDKKQIEQKNALVNTLNNIYFKKVINEITSNLSPRYLEIQYVSKDGDTYEGILKKLQFDLKEKKIILKSIMEKKTLKILRTGQNFYFKIDKLNNNRVTEFKIETSKKNEMLFTRYEDNLGFNSELIEKNFSKIIVYKEAIILSSLYNSAINAGIKPNLIVDFARLYGFQVDFQRDVWKDDSFQIIYEEYRDKSGKLIDTGNIIFANLNLQNRDLQLYRHEYKKNEFDFFDENGRSFKKTLMKTPINGARLSSSFGNRKHPILGYTKMHTGTDFAAPTGTPIMASGDGIVVRAKWCGGGGNCIKIKHNSVYQTVYAHLSKFNRGIKKGVRVKQGQIIGFVGSTGLSTGPHLHYEVIENGKKINSQKLKLPSGKILKNKQREKFEISKIKIDVLKSELISKLN